MFYRKSPLREELLTVYYKCLIYYPYRVLKILFFIGCENSLTQPLKGSTQAQAVQ